MKKIKLTETELTRLIEKVIREQIGDKAKQPINEQRDIVQWTKEEKKQVLRQLDDIHIKIDDMYTDWIELHP